MAEIPPWVLATHGIENAWRAICPNCPEWLSPKGHCRRCNKRDPKPDADAAAEVSARLMPHDKPLKNLTPLQRRIVDAATSAAMTREQVYHHGQKWGTRLKFNKVGIRETARAVGCDHKYVRKVMTLAAKK